MGVVVRQVTHPPGKGVLHDLSFSFEGGLLAVLGPPRSGKGTLLPLLAGVTAPKRGRIEVYGKSPQREEVRRSIGYVPAGAGLTPGLTVAEALDFHLMLRRVRDPEERRTRIKTTLDRLGLHGAGEGPTSTIPPWVGFWVSIAQAMLCEPQLLIVHEPPDLTAEARCRVRSVLRGLSAETKVLLASDEPRGIEKVATQVCILQEGRLRFFGSPAEVASTAGGHTWETDVGAGQEASFVYGFVATGEEAIPGGRRVRGVSRDRPAPNARPAAPDFFDGYTWCLATDEAAVRPTESAAVAEGVTALRQEE